MLADGTPAPARFKCERSRADARFVNAEAPTPRMLGPATAALSIAALIGGVGLAAGTTTIGPTRTTAHFASDAKALIVLLAVGIAAASLLGARTRSPQMALVAAVAVAGAGVATLAEVRRCVGHWHAAAAQAAIAGGYGAAGAHNRYGHGVEVVAAGGLLAIVAAVAIAACARTRPQRAGVQDQLSP
jgi:hypothetical protein